MSEFLHLLSPTEALKRFLENLQAGPLGIEEIAVDQALGRVSAAPMLADDPLPSFPRSTVDGYAVRAQDTYGAGETLPAFLSILGEVPMGARPSFELQPGQAALIHTGGMLPSKADAVVMLEYTQRVDNEIEVVRAVGIGENTLQIGEDVAAGQEVIAAGTLLRPAEMGGLYAVGKLHISVARKPVVAILSSGDEVVPPEVSPLPGQVRDINSAALAAFVIQCGGIPQPFGIVADRPDELESRLRAALEQCDAAVITAGSSASTRDLTAATIQAIGSPGVLVHGVNVRPGKPTILGVCNGKAVVGLPGNPVSALIIAGLFVRPLIEWLLGLSNRRPAAVVRAKLTVNLPSQTGREDWAPVNLVETPDGIEAVPIFFKSNLIFNLVRADGLLYVPSDMNGISAGEMVNVHLF